MQFKKNTSEKVIQRLYRLVIVIVLGGGFTNYSIANKSIDSLQTVLKTAIEDSNKVNTLNLLGQKQYKADDFKNALFNCNLAFKLSEKLNFTKGKLNALFQIATIYKYQSNYTESINNYLSYLALAELAGDTTAIANAYNNIGNVYSTVGDYPVALKNLLTASSLFEKTGNKKGYVTSLNAMGTLYRLQGDLQMAQEKFLSALKLAEQSPDKRNLAISYMGMGTVYQLKFDYVLARDCFYKALNVFKTLDENNSIAAAYGNIGISYMDEKNYSKAKEIFMLVYDTFQKLGNKDGVANVLNLIGAIEISEKNFSAAEKNINTSLTISKSIHSKFHLKEGYLNKYILDSALGNYKASLENYKLFIDYRDSLVSEENKKKITQIQMQHDFDKKSALMQVENLRKQAIADEEIKKQRVTIYYSIAVGALLLLLLVIAGVGYRRKQLDNAIILKQKSQVEIQKNIIEIKTKEITESINYAKAIQEAMLPGIQHFSELFKNSFILFMPKDIVSGDFYWFYKMGDVVLVAAADCTGHGVPGAFTSLICSEKLNDTAHIISNPGDILSAVNIAIKTSLHQTSGTASTIRDGMDIALCAYNIKQNSLAFAGANRPLWIVRKGAVEVEEIKPTKMAIGGYTDDNQYFETQTVQLFTGDSFYIFSDGYADQDGGEKGGKLMTKNFKQLLLKIQNQSMAEQNQTLKSFINTWQGEKEQLDDILVIGVRV